MKDIKEFEKKKCSKCKYNKKEFADLCEITRSRLDNHLDCKNFIKDIEKNK